MTEEELDALVKRLEASAAISSRGALADLDWDAAAAIRSLRAQLAAATEREVALREELREISNSGFIPIARQAAILRERQDTDGPVQTIATPYDHETDPDDPFAPGNR